MQTIKESKTILVTGGAGFIGSHVAKKLMDLGHNVVIVDNFNSYYDPRLKEARISEFLKGYPLKIYRIDIADFQTLRRVFPKEHIDIVCHEASQAGVRYSLKNPLLFVRTNVLGTLNLLECAKEFGMRGFIYVSSSSVYGKNKPPFREEAPLDTPLSLYAATKIGAESLIHTYHAVHGFPCTILRYFSVYGPWGRPDMILFKFLQAMEKGKVIPVYNFGNTKRDWTYIDDIVDGTVAAIQKNYPYEIFNLGNNKPKKLSYFIEVLERYAGKKFKKKYFPMQKGDLKESHAHIAKAKKFLEWKPKVSFEQGISACVEWYKARGYVFKEFKD